MTTLPGCDAPTADLMSVEAAREHIAALVTPVCEQESLGLRDALDRVLAADVLSPINVPPHTNSAMDGYALRGSDLPADGEASLNIVGTSWAGKPFEGAVNTGECVRIMTGAKLPADTDTVIMQEHVTREDDSIRIGTGHKAGQNVRHPGEDIEKGKAVLHAGRRVTPADLGVLASLGIPEVTVLRKLRVVFFSSGDELRGVGEELEEGQIYDSNRYTLHGMLTRLGVDFTDLGVIRDTPEDVRAAFEKAAGMGDVVITTGGVSVGDADFIKDTLAQMGEVNFWKLAMKPGKPLAVGRLGEALFFGLPGNPVSVMATFYQFVQPALRRMAGETAPERLTLRVRTMTPLKKHPGRTDFQRGILHHDENGELVVRSTGMQGSHVLTSMSLANCFIILPRDSGSIEAGEMVEVEPFAGMI